jgi:hypothetical protein
MKTRLITICCGLVALLMATSCIVSDQVTTLIIKPDGSADVIVTRSNIHFRGNEQKRAEELKAFRNKFNNQEQWWFERIEGAGGRIEEARWIKKTEPMAHYIRGALPGRNELEQLLSLEQKDNKWNLTSDFRTDGSNRELLIRISPPKEKELSVPSDEAERMRQQLANRISHTRIAVVKGEITDATGFIVADDGQSALLDRSAFPDTLWTRNETITISLQWTVNT